MTVVAYEFEDGNMACPDCYEAYYTLFPATARDEQDVANRQEGQYIHCEGCGYPVDPRYEIDHGLWDPKPKRAVSA